MEKSKINTFLITKSKYFSDNQRFMLTEQLKELSDDRAMQLHGIEFKNPDTFLILSLLVPFFALIERFFLNDMTMAVLKLITFGGLGLWVFIDFFTVRDRVRNYNFQKIQPFLIN